MSGGVMTVVLMSPILAGGAPFVFGANEATGSAVTLVANGVIFFVVLADVARCASLILRYRRDSLA
jgi:hypothetical protein